MFDRQPLEINLVLSLRLPLAQFFTVTSITLFGTQVENNFRSKIVKYLLFTAAVKVLNFKKNAVDRPEYLQTL